MERSWYYSVNRSEKQGPVPEAELKQLIAAGRIGPADVVWAEGMANWTAVSQLPELQGGAAAALVTAGPGPAAATLPPKLLGWMNFVGVMTVIYGVFQCLSCIGILWGVFLVIAGIALLGARTALAAAPRVDPSLSPFFEKLNSFMCMTGIGWIIMLVIMVLMLLVYGIFFAAIFSSAFS
jgi:hypothetical protein